ncbi:AAA family ATPase (plasmid) [Streptomyces sp. SDT5-1]|uniref:AAA family ATPase n=1 Tax=Streptomyces sp. SDT5-1 TaxID=3406418 RepID=UPI003FD3DCE1
MTEADPQIADNSLVVLIGPAGAGKSTLANTWSASQVLSLDALRETVSDDAGDQAATNDAVAALHLLLEARMRRRRFTVVDATNVTRAARKPLVEAAKRHGMLPIALLVPTPATVCVKRQSGRDTNRSVPKHVVLEQHQNMVTSAGTLKKEGFHDVVFAESLHRLLPLLKRISTARRSDPTPADGDLLLVRRVFGDAILPLWQWKPGSDIAEGDRVAEIRLGQQYLTLTLRPNVGGLGESGFEVQVPCPQDDDCTGRAWVPVTGVTCLFRALSGELDGDDGIFCTVHGLTPGDEADEPDGLQAETTEAVC